MSYTRGTNDDMFEIARRLFSEIVVDGEEWEALLRVARAARALYPHIYLVDEVLTGVNMEGTREELYEALKEVEHLL